MTLTDNERRIGFVELALPETSRTYQFPGSESLTFHNVTKIAVRPSGNHRLMCDEGRVIVAPGWLALSFVSSDWEF